MFRQFAKLGTAWILLLGIAGHCQSAPPYHESSTLPRTYNGPGREDPEPPRSSWVNIGYFGPAGPGPNQSLWQGASLAVEQANRAGGYHGTPFHLVPSWSDSPWSGGASSLIQSVYKDDLVAIIGGIDGSTTHLAEQITTKIQITLVNPISTDRSIHGADLPWVFSCVPGDDRVAPLIAQALRHQQPFALLSSTDHDSRAFVAELKAAFVREQIAPAMHLQFETGNSAIDVADTLLSSGAREAVVVGNVDESRSVIIALRRAGFVGIIYAGRSLAGGESGDRLHNTITPVLARIAPDFRTAFLAAYGSEPDNAAAQSYDAANLLILAIRNVGVNRARVRDAIRALSPYDGVSGRIEWDALGQVQRPITLQKVDSPAIATRQQTSSP